MVIGTTIDHVPTLTKSRKGGEGSWYPLYSTSTRYWVNWLPSSNLICLKFSARAIVVANLVRHFVSTSGASFSSNMERLSAFRWFINREGRTRILGNSHVSMRQVEQRYKISPFRTSLVHTSTGNVCRLVYSCWWSHPSRGVGVLWW